MKKIQLTIIVVTTFIILSCEKNETATITASAQEQETVETKETSVDHFFDAGLPRASKEQLAPDFTVKDLDDNDVSLSDFKGQVVFLNFWASWCGPCISEMPSIQSLYEQTEDLDVKILTLNIGESKEIAKQFIDKYNYTFHTILDPENRVAGMYGVRSIPTTYIIDKTGMIVTGKLGAHEWDSPEIVEILKELSK